MAECMNCGEEYPNARKALGYSFCLQCGQIQAVQERKSWTVAPIAYKQGATLVRNIRDLRNWNPKAASLDGYV